MHPSLPGPGEPCFYWSCLLFSSPGEGKKKNQVDEYIISLCQHAVPINLALYFKLACVCLYI